MFTSEIPTISLEEAQNLVTRGIGLVLGPGATSSNTRDECYRYLQDRFTEVKRDASMPTFREFGERAAAVLRTQQDVRAIAVDYFARAKPLPLAQKLAKINWKAVVSLCEDTVFREAITLHLDSLPTARSATLVSHPDVTIAPPTIAIFQLLGDPCDERENARLAVFPAEYLRRRRSWRDMLSMAADSLKGAALLFLGTGDSVELTADFINEALALRPGLTQTLFFVQEDPTPLHRPVIELARERCRVYRIRASAADVIASLGSQSIGSAIQTNFEFTDLAYDPKPLHSISDYAVRVPLAAELPEVVEADRSRLLDILFSPNQLDWQPYRADLDFERDIGKRLVQRINNAWTLAKSPKDRLITIRGESGTGKTTALRRLAFAFTQTRALCIWLRGLHTDYGSKRLEALSRAIEKAVSGKHVNVLVFCDDLASTNLSLIDRREKFISFGC